MVCSLHFCRLFLLLDGDIDPALDIIVSLVSIAIAAIFNLSKVFRQIWPHLSLLFAFALFVAWNGGVVLGMIIFFALFTKVYL